MDLGDAKMHGLIQEVKNVKWRSLIVALAMLAFVASVTEAKGKSPSTKTVPLDAVVQEVRGALSDYQAEVTASNNPLPPLRSAEFDFKTVTERDATGGFSILIFTFKASKKSQQTSDLQFHYEVPTPVQTASNQPPPSVREALLNLIRSAAQTLKSSGGSNALANMKVSNVSISIEYSVTSSINAEGKPVIHFVTLDLGGGYSKNEVQSIKLVFERK